MNITTWNFNGATIRTVILPNGEPGFVGKDVSARLGYTNPSKAMGDHCKGVTISYPLQTAGGTQNVRILTEPDVLRLIISSKLPAAQEFERWVFEEVLPSIRKTGSYAAKPIPAAVPASVEAVMFAEAVNRALRLEGSAALGMVRKATELTAPHLLPMLPAYAIDAPPSELATRGSSRPTASMLAILHSVFAEWPGKKPNNRMVSGVYAALQKAGILEQRTRASTSNPAGVKQFWSITEKGLEFGKNITSEKNQRETAPHWYTDTACKLLDIAIAIDAARNT